LAQHYSIIVRACERARQWKVALFYNYLLKFGQNQKSKDLNCLRRDDRQFASWRIIIDDIQRGKIAGLGGENSHGQNRRIRFWILCFSPRQPCEVCSRSIPKIPGGSFGEHPLPVD
jgi:hypothetical protein